MKNHFAILLSHSQTFQAQAARVAYNSPIADAVPIIAAQAEAVRNRLLQRCDQEEANLAYMPTTIGIDGEVQQPAPLVERQSLFEQAALLVSHFLLLTSAIMTYRIYSILIAFTFTALVFIKTKSNNCFSKQNDFQIDL